MVSSTPPVTREASPLIFVDTHCHLDDVSFADDLPEVLERSRGQGVTRWINVGFNPDRWGASIDLASRYPGLSCMMGVHPGDAAIWDDRVRADLETAVHRFEPVAIGEIGLDFFRGESNLEQQTRAFHSQLDLARDVDIPAVIHMRSAEPLMLDILQSRDDLPSLHFHSYDGSRLMTDWIVSSGASVGVGGLATRSKSTALREQLRRIPLERIVVETDAPYLVPNGFRHRRNTPESIPIVASFLAALFETGIEEISARTTASAEKIFEGIRFE